MISLAIALALQLEPAKTMVATVTPAPPAASAPYRTVPAPQIKPPRIAQQPNPHPSGTAWRAPAAAPPVVAQQPNPHPTGQNWG
jgi:hypothetical protein